MLLSVSTQFPQVRFHCRNPRCSLALKISTDNSRDAFCCRSCERRYYSFHCRVCEAAIPLGTSRKQVCGQSKCRYQFKRHPERFFGLRYIGSGIAHNARANPIRIGVKSDGKSGRGWRIIAGPTDLHPINLHPFPADVAASRTGRTGPVLITRTTPPINVVGRGIFKFLGPTTVVLHPSRTAPPVLTIQGDGDGIDIPAFLRRTLAVERGPS